MQLDCFLALLPMPRGFSCYTVALKGSANDPITKALAAERFVNTHVQEGRVSILEK